MANSSTQFENPGTGIVCDRARRSLGCRKTVELVHKENELRLALGKKRLRGVNVCGGARRCASMRGVRRHAVACRHMPSRVACAFSRCSSAVPQPETDFVVERELPMCVTSSESWRSLITSDDLVTSLCLRNVAISDVRTFSADAGESVQLGAG